MQRFLVIVFALTICNSKSSAQSRDSVPKIRFDITGGFYHQIAADDGLPTMGLPAYLSQRRPQEPDVASIWGLNGDKATDSPLGHAGTYWRIHSWYEVSENLEIYGSLEVDHRGFSFSAYNTEQVAFLPRYHVRYHDSFMMDRLRDSLRLSFQVGTWENFKSFEGLIMYNIDVQGLRATIGFKNFTVSMTNVADLQFGIGLNLDGLIIHELAYDKKFGHDWSMIVKAGFQDLKDDDFPDKFDIASLSLHVRKRALAFYTEWGYRQNSPYSGLLRHAYIAGLHTQSHNRKGNLKLRLEYRWYGGGFNDQLRNETLTHYRKSDQMPGGNYIGNHVYPLSFLNRPFSQWAVFTEYDKRWVSGISFQSSITARVWKSISMEIETDLNLIQAEDEEPFLYPFFKIGPSIGSWKNTQMAFSITNKTMNLDKHYPTYYLLTRPLLQIELRRDL